MKKENLVDKIITLYLDGGWELSGRVVKDDEKKLIIEHDENLYMAFKDKISCLILLEEGRRAGPEHNSMMPEAPTPIRRIDDKVREDYSDPFPMNGMSYDETVMSLPGTLIGESSQNLDDELVVFYPQGAGLPKEETKGEVKSSGSSISFEVENDSEE
jgi:sRNA-binding regulator protein Hfq